MKIDQQVKIKTIKGGYRKAKIIGIVQSWHADDACLIEYLDGSVEQIPAKFLKT